MVAMAMAAGCGGRNDVEMGPEDTVKAFCRAVAGGDMEEAMSLCDTITMKGYIEEYAAAWGMLAEKDSSATAIAASSLAEADIIIEDMVKEGGDRRMITYSIITCHGLEKKKKAAVRKEEGAWKVEEITDCH